MRYWPLIDCLSISSGQSWSVRRQRGLSAYQIYRFVVVPHLAARESLSRSEGQGGFLTIDRRSRVSYRAIFRCRARRSVSHDTRFLVIHAGTYFTRGLHALPDTARHQISEWVYRAQSGSRYRSVPTLDDRDPSPCIAPTPSRPLPISDHARWPRSASSLRERPSNGSAS